jgi:hypothetical protein
MHCEARLRAIGARTLRDPGELERPTDRDMPGHRRSTRSGHATARRFAASHPYGPVRAPPGPQDRRKLAENNLPPNRSPGPSREKASQPTPSAASPPATCSTSFKLSRPAATAQVLTRPPSTRSRKRPAGKQRRRQAGPSTGRRRTQDRCILTPPATASRTRPPQPASASHRQPRRTASRGRNPARTIPTGLDLFYDWSRPQGSRYQHGFSTRSGNDGKQPARSGQTGHETGPVNSRADRPTSQVHDRYIRRSG